VQDWKEIRELIENHSFFVVLSHEEPDGDAVGSSIALGSLLSRLGKSVALCSPGPFARREVAEYHELFLDETPPDLLGGDTAFVILDASTPERLGRFAPILRDRPVAVIDHHGGSPFGAFRVVDSQAPSTSFLILELFDALGVPPSPEEAAMLLFGLCTDTGFFRHAERNSEEVLRAAGRLASYGVSLKEIHRMMHPSVPVESRVLLGRTLASTESLFSDQVLIARETLEDHRRFGLENRDSDTLYQMLQGVRGCRAVAFIREEGDGCFSVGLRSSDTLDVGGLARRHGGGGHQKAASFRYAGTEEELRRLLAEEFGKAIAEAEGNGI
jgi:phosphoesterase RecJ-like protein